MGEFCGKSIALNFGEVGSEYAAMHKAAGLFDAAHRGVLEITGIDRHKFLGNLLSNDTQLRPGMVRGAFLLNHKGRVACEVNLIERDSETTLLETAAHHVPLLATLFEKYHFSEKVKFVDRSTDKSTEKSTELAQLWLVGPGAATLASIAFSCDVLTTPMTCTNVGSACLWRDDLNDLIVVGVIIPRDTLSDVIKRLIETFGQEVSIGRRALRRVGWNAFNVVRIEAGRPILGIDFEPAPPAIPGKTATADAPDTAGTAGVLPTSAYLLPAETGLAHRNVSFTKGCYLGQEVVARMYSRGQLARKIVPFVMQGEELPIAGAQVFEETGQPENSQTQIGVVTSSAPSPAQSNRAIGLALLKKPHFEPGSKLLIGAEGAMHGAKVG